MKKVKDPDGDYDVDQAETFPACFDIRGMWVSLLNTR